MAESVSRSHTSRPESLAQCELGAGTTWAMLICTLGLFFYIRVGRAYFLLHFTPLYDSLATVTLILISLFTAGCSLHMMFIGEVSDRGLREHVRERAKKLEELAELVRTELALREQRVCLHNGSLGSIAIRALSTTKRLSRALDLKVEQLHGMLSKPSGQRLAAAFELLESPLETDSDCYTQLIVGDPIAPIPRDELLPTIRELFRDIDTSFARFARDEKLAVFDTDDESEVVPSIRSKNEADREARRSTIH